MDASETRTIGHEEDLTDRGADMIKALQVTSVVVGLLAVGLIALSVVHGTEPDADVAKILASIGVLEQFEKQRGKLAGSSQIPARSPLVAEAEKYARIVNPPRAPAPLDRLNSQGHTFRKPPRPDVRPLQSNAKFTLEATCLNADDPSASLAFITEPGKGQHWVRQGDRLGHLTIEEILNGLIKLRDGQRIEELRVQREPKISLYAGSGNKRRPKTRSSGIAPTAETLVPRGNAISVFSASPGLSRSATRPLRRPIETKEDIQEIERITTALRNFKQPLDLNMSPEDLEARRLIREQALERLLKVRKKFMADSERAKGTKTDPNR